MKIVFMGTPEFAAYQLEQLHHSKHQVLAAVTMPDKAAGRGLKMQASAVKLCAERLQIPVIQPEKLKNQEFLSQLKSLNADLFVVVAFRMLPELVWNMPPFGTINLHASLLPQYRGAAPINWAIISGDQKSGVSTFFITHEIDTGDLLLTDEVQIGADENAGDLHDKLMKQGAITLVKTLDQLESKQLKARPQSEISTDTLRFAPKLFKHNTEIDWSLPAKQLHNFIRGLSPYPGAWTTVHFKNGKTLGLKIYKSAISELNLQSGIILKQGKNCFVGTGNGSLELKELQLEGKKRLPIDAFLAGFDPDQVLKLG